MSQIESEFIPYRMSGLDYIRRSMNYNYEPIRLLGMKTVPGKHVRLAKVMYRIGYWFTEKAEDWDDHTFFVTPKMNKYPQKIRFGDYTIGDDELKVKFKQPEYIRHEERGKPK